MGDIDARAREILDFERDWAAHQGGKAQAIQQRFGISAARYYQLLARTLDDPAALGYDPLTVRRLRRRRIQRSARTTTAAARQRWRR